MSVIVSSKQTSVLTRTLQDQESHLFHIVSIDLNPSLAVNIIQVAMLCPPPMTIAIWARTFLTNHSMSSCCLGGSAPSRSKTVGIVAVAASEQHRKHIGFVQPLGTVFLYDN